MFAVAGKLARDNKLEHYRLLSNGPGKQMVTYLHFHLLGKPIHDQNHPDSKPE